MLRSLTVPLVAMLSVLLTAAGCATDSDAASPDVASTPTGKAAAPYRYAVLAGPTEAVGTNLPRAALPSEAESAIEATPIGDEPSRPAFVIRSTGGRLCLTVRSGQGSWGYTCGDPARDQRGGILLVAEPAAGGLWNVSALVPDGITSATTRAGSHPVRGNFVRFPISRSTARVTFKGDVEDRTLDLAGLIR